MDESTAISRSDADAPEASVNAMIERARVETLYRFNRSGVALTLVLGPLAAWRLGAASEPQQFWIWGIGLVLLALLRASLGYLFATRRIQHPDTYWHRAMICASLCVGVCWGIIVLPWFDMPPDVRLIATSLLLAVTGIGLVSFMVSTPAFLALAIPVFVCLMIACLTQPVTLAREAAMLVAFFVAIMVFSSLRMRRQFEDVLRARWREAEMRREADQANAAKSRFLAAMSHELRTPLNGMLGMAEMLARARLGAPCEGYVQSIQKTGRHLTAVVADVLDFARLEAHQLQVVTAPVALRPLVADTLLPWELEARNKGLVFGVEVDPELPEWIETDALRFAQVLINLVSNAIKFTEHGEVGVAVRRGGRGRIELTVTDSGIGIEEGDLARIFDPFAQGDRTSQRRYGGTGLGLSISMRLAELLGGELDAASTRGRGSRFVFQVPLVESRPPETVATDESPGLWLDAEVLVAEDNELNREIAQLFLESLGLRVRTACNGVEAIAAWRERRPDLILMDCEMPELDGLAAVRELRAIGARGPIIALTAHALPEDRQACLDAGMDAVLTKPLDLKELRQTLGRILGGTPA